MSRLLKYNSYFTILLFFFTIIPKNTFCWDLGLKAGASYQSFNMDGKNNAIEFSSFGGEIGVFTAFLLHPRFILMTDLGVNIYTQFFSPYLGITMAFVFYPEYLPFIGISIKERYTNKIFDKKHYWNTNFYISAGSKLYFKENHSLWLLLDYLAFQTLNTTYNSSAISLSLAYSYHFN